MRPPKGGPAARRLLQALNALGLGWLAFLLAIRTIRYLPWRPPERLDSLLGTLMVVDAQWFLWSWVIGMVLMRWSLILAPAALALAVFGRRRLLNPEGGAWRLSPLGTSLLLVALLWFQYLADSNPFVTSACAASMAWTWVSRRISKAPAALGWLVLFAAGMLAPKDGTDRFTLAVWAAFLWAAHGLPARTLRPLEWWALLALGILPMNLLSALVPWVLPAVHGGTRLGDGLAYDFCELPEREGLLATLPGCTSLGNDECRDGRVAVYDSKSLKRIRDYAPLPPGHSGRLEQLLCLRDQIYVAVQNYDCDNRPNHRSALAFDPDSPRGSTPNVGGCNVGTGLSYDAGRDAVFFTGEYTDNIVRLDRKSGRRTLLSHDWLLARAPTFPFEGSFHVTGRSYDAKRDRLYVAEWMQGRYVHALDLASLRSVGRFPVNDGGSFGATVDSERGRLYVSGLWGLEVFDMDTGLLIARKRLGLAPRPAVVDAPRNRIYVASSGDGKIRVLDRDSLETIAQIPVGLGTRHPYLSRDGTRLFATNSRSHYGWWAYSIGGAGWLERWWKSPSNSSPAQPHSPG